MTSCSVGYAACLATIMINCKTAVQKQHAFEVLQAIGFRCGRVMCYCVVDFVQVFEFSLQLA